MDERIVIDVLIQLARCEEELALARSRRQRAKTRSGDLNELQAEYDDDVAAASDAASELARRQRAKERELRELETDLAQRRRRLAGTGDERQSAALRGEIDHLQRRLSEVETEALEMMEQLAAGEDGSAEAIRARDRQQQRRDRELAELQEQVAQGEAAEAEIIDEVARLLQQLPPEVARHVERLRQKYETAVCYVQSGACGGCFIQLPPQQGVAAESGRSLIRCPGCARYVVRRPWA